MALNMDLIVFGQTGHVLAAALRQQTAGSGPTPKDLVGDGLWLRNPADGAVQLIVGADQLSIVSLPARDDILVTARRFQVVDGLPEAKDELTGATPVKLDGSTVTVTLPAAVTSDTDVWVVISGISGTLVQKVGIAKGSASASEPLPLPAGTYQALVLATGFRALVVKITF
jgi:hypothetical protein